MKNKGWILVIAVAFVLGTVVGAAAAKKAPIDPSIYAGKPPKEAGAALLPIAKRIADKGSWENIAVGRVYYLSGQKAEGQAIFDAVTGKKAEGGDWIRIGRVYWEANEWDKAKAAFDKVLKLSPDDEDWLAEIGAYYQLKGDRAKAEELFGRSFARDSNNLWNTLRAACSYLGIAPPA
ncbi:MAG TPA: tetratricopeptide repeat protein [Thermoanaerobaculia bacterium]|nr:tetratricopeptide repeat protein [Thermoanaerobaculia bacterium]